MAGSKPLMGSKHIVPECTSKGNKKLSIIHLGREGTIDEEKNPSFFQNTFIGTARNLLYHLESIWLFTYSDLKTIVFPEAIFGTMNAIAAQSFDISPYRSASQIVQRFPLVLIWTWINLLPFAIDNQRRPDAILEDGVNKPWRTLPSKRMSPHRARQIMLTLWPVAILTSLCLGGFWPSISLIILAYWYNEGRGADSSCIIRNFINTCGFCCYSIGAMEVALGSPVAFTSRLTQWLLIVGFVVFTTVHTQDMSDQEGDGLRRRKTVPIVLGDGLTRMLTAIPMFVWCVASPWYWHSSFWVYAVSAGLGCLIIIRMLTKRSVEDDKMTFWWWNAWLVFVYSMPLLSYLEAVDIGH